MEEHMVRTLLGKFHHHLANPPCLASKDKNTLHLGRLVLFAHVDTVTSLSVVYSCDDDDMDYVGVWRLAVDPKPQQDRYGGRVRWESHLFFLRYDDSGTSSP
jgi:hypothetical protein